MSLARLCTSLKRSGEDNPLLLLSLPPPHQQIRLPRPLRCPYWTEMLVGSRSITPPLVLSFRTASPRRMERSWGGMVARTLSSVRPFLPSSSYVVLLTCVPAASPLDRSRRTHPTCFSFGTTSADRPSVTTYPLSSGTEGRLLARDYSHRSSLSSRRDGSRPFAPAFSLLPPRTVNLPPLLLQSLARPRPPILNTYELESRTKLLAGWTLFWLSSPSHSFANRPVSTPRFGTSYRSA